MQNISKFRLNFDFSGLKVVEGFISHFCTSNLGNTLGCLISIGYILETMIFFFKVKMFGTLSYITMLYILQFSRGSYMSSMRPTDLIDVSN